MTMKFFIKQRMLSFSDSFVIRDEKKRPAYTVQGKLFAFGDKLKLYDMNNQERIYIEQKLFRLLPEYHLYENGKRVAVVKKGFTLLTPKFSIQSDSGSYKVKGNLFAYNFTIAKEGAVVARVRKALFAFRDSYSVEISPGEDEALLLAMCIVIDQTLHDDNHNNN